MWLTESQIRELDTPAGRAELSSLATRLAREALPGADIEIFWDGSWIRRVGPVSFPDPDLFGAAEPNWTAARLPMSSSPAPTRSEAGATP